MLFRIIFIISMLSIFSNNVHAQTAPDLGILWQKEYPDLNIQFAKFSKDGQYVYLATERNILKMSAETGEILSTFDNTGLPTIYKIFSLSISNSGNYLAANDGYGEICIWDTRTEKPYKAILFGERGKDSSSSNAVFTSDEKFLIINFYIMNPKDNPEYIIVYNLETDEQVARWHVPGLVSQIAISHDGKYFVTGTAYMDNFTQKWYNKLILWETGTWKQAAVLEDVEGQVDGYSRIKFSYNDGFLGSVRGSLYNVHIFDLSTKQFIKSSENGRMCGNMEFLPDNQHFLFLYYDPKKEEHSIELHDFNNFIKSYSVRAGIVDSYDSSGIWKIFCYAWNTFSMLSNQTTSVTEKQKENVFRIYYDNGMVIIEMNSNLIFPTDFKIYNILGNTLYSSSIPEATRNNIYNVNINLLSGLYVCKITSGNNEYSIKFEVSR